MSVGLGLLYTLVSDNTRISILEDNHIDRDFFVKEEKRVYDFIFRYLDTYRQLPSHRTIEVETDIRFPEFPQEPIEYWMHQVRDRNDARRMLSVSDNVRFLLRSGDTVSAKKEIQSLYEELQRDYLTKNTATLKDLAPKVLSRHDQRQKLGRMMGIPFGFPYLDRVSDGAQAGDTVIIVGRPSTGKSYVLFKMIIEAYSFGYMPLVISMEMPAEQCARRLLSLYTNVSATAIRLGRLSYWGRQRLVEGIDGLSDDFPFPIIQGSLVVTIESIGDKIREIQPHAVYLDGGYLPHTRVKTSSRWERVTEVAEIMKKYAGSYGIPIFASYQFNRKGPGLGNIGLSDAIGQLASIVISIEDEKSMSASAPKGIFYKTLELIKGREGEKGKILIIYNMMRMLIQQHSVIEDFSMGDYE